MEAIAQESIGDAVVAVGTSAANQYMMLGAILLGLAAFLWFLPVIIGRFRTATDSGKSSDGDGTGLRDFLAAKFTDLGNRVGSIKEDVVELKADFRTHAEQDRQNFRDLYARTERETWTAEERQQRRGRQA